MRGIRSIAAYTGGLLILLALAMLFNAHHILGKSRVEFRQASSTELTRAHKADQLAKQALSAEVMDHKFSKNGTSASDVAFVADVRLLMKDADHLHRKPKHAKPDDPDFKAVLTELRQLMPPLEPTSNARRLVPDTQAWNQALTHLAETAQAVTLQSATDMKKDALKSQAEGFPARTKMVETGVLVLFAGLLLALALQGLHEKTGPTFKGA